MKPAIGQIAKICGVSKSTVSRVLNGHPYVKEDLRSRILEAMRKLNYAPRQLAVRKVVAFAVEGIGSKMGLYEASLVSNLAGHIMKRGLSVRIHPAEDFDIGRDFDVRCIIATSFSLDAKALLRLRKGVPAIAINNSVEGFHSVCSDHAQGLSLAVERLAALGHRRIAFLVSSAKGWGNSSRIRGYKAAVKSLNLDSAPNLLQRWDEQGMTEAVAKALLAKPTAIVVSGEDAAISANYALHILGRRVPEDISLLTFESPNFSKHLLPPNSTIDQGIEQIAAAAAELAATLVDGDAPSRIERIIATNKYIERESTRNINQELEEHHE